VVNVIGISAYYHDSSCCLLKDGKLVAAASEERFTRRKHDPDLPVQAFKYCMREGGLTLADIDCIAYYEQPEVKLERQLWNYFEHPKSFVTQRSNLDPFRPVREIRRRLGFEGRLEIVSHHESHAASSYFYSEFPEAAILTVDAVGEWATTTYGKGKGTELQLFEEVHFPDSIGILYSTITAFLGFEINDGEYKVMGLAPYGKPIYADKLWKMIELGERGSVTLDMSYFDFLSGGKMYSPKVEELLGHPPRDPESDLSEFARDLAQSMQVVLEDIMLSKVRYLHSEVGGDNLCMAGGVALNCTANGQILRKGPFKKMFVQPASSDAGTCLGAAALAYSRITGTKPQVTQHDSINGGPSYDTPAAKVAVEEMGLTYEDFTGRRKELLEKTAKVLADGKVIGWMQGRMEFGPRALGRRSILGDPRNPVMRELVNALVKKREAFRPFAPAALLAETQKHFDIDHQSPFMLETCQVKSSIDMPAITHVNGSARLQTVDPNKDPKFGELLIEFFRQTGCPVLLNTSFNLRGEPIVCTPEDAIKCYLNCDLDYLIIEDLFITKENLPSHLARPKVAANFTRPTKDTTRAHNVYTFV
jgi:carbamoyltransferase